MSKLRKIVNNCALGVDLAAGIYCAFGVNTTLTITGKITSGIGATISMYDLYRVIWQEKDSIYTKLADIIYSPIASFKAQEKAFRE